jgi:hypothetical protein
MTAPSPREDRCNWIQDSALAAEARRVCADPTRIAPSYESADHLSRDVKDHLRSILMAPKALISTQSASYHHSLGYTKLIIWEGKCGQRLRLHLWDELEDFGDVHDHFWDFRSVALRGAVRFNHYRIDEGYEFQRFRMIPRGNGSFVTEACGTANMQIAEKRLCIQGQHYSTRAEVLHASKPLGRAITLVFQGARTRAENQIARRMPLDGPWECVAEPLGLSTLVGLLERLTASDDLDPL